MTDNPSQIIAVVCRLNQARSIMVSAYLSRILPDLKVISAGVDAIDGQEIPLSIQRLAHDWALEIDKDFSQSVAACLDEILQAELVIVAENSFIQILVDLGIDSTKILSMQDSSFDLTQIPRDPLNLDSDAFEVELAKAIMVSVQLISKRNLLSFAHQIEVVHPETENEFQACLMQTLELARVANASVLVADFRFPQADKIEQLGLVYGQLRIERSQGEIVTNVSSLNVAEPCLVATKFEIDFAEEFILSESFLNLLRTLTKNRPLFVITGQRNSIFRQYSEPYLTASYRFVK